MASFNFAILSILFCFFLSFSSVSGHGYVKGPFSSRNIMINHSCQHCANGRGVCGEGGQWRADATVLDVISKYTNPLGKLIAGEILEIDIQLTVGHYGLFVMELCRPNGPKITEECFSVRLNRDPTDSRYSPYVPTDPTIAFFQRDNCVTKSVQKVRYLIPKDFLTCDHCILRWAWQTGNSCISHPLASNGETTDAIRNWISVDGCGIGLKTGNTFCGTNCPTPRCAAEQFKNCIDVQVVNSGIVQPTTTTKKPEITTKPTTTKKTEMTTKPTTTKKTEMTTTGKVTLPTVSNPSTDCSLWTGITSDQDEWCRTVGCYNCVHLTGDALDRCLLNLSRFCKFPSPKNNQQQEEEEE